MEYITGSREFQIEVPTVVSIGKFDGRHRGHQKLLKTMLGLKAEKGYQTAVFTFQVPPAALISGCEQKMITTNYERRQNLCKIGIDYLVEYPFSNEVAHMPAEEFVEKILVTQMNAKAIVVGTDCGFGYRRAGNAQLLKKLQDVYGYELIVIEKAKDEDRVISSTYVREEMDRGNMEKANELLGEPYAIHGIVVHGNHIGGPLLGFPTANLVPPEEKYLPPFGVYVSIVAVNGRTYGGISNIGRKPTIDGVNPVGVETFIFGIDQDIYGKPMEVQLLHFVRPEQKFDGLDALKGQIERDKQSAVDYLSQYMGKPDNS